MTGIEPALSAWESDRITPPEGLTWRFDCPLLTVAGPWLPGLMGRQWPDDLPSGWSMSTGGRSCTCCLVMLSWTPSSSTAVTDLERNLAAAFARD